MKELISVYIPTKNRVKTLKKAINSVLRQSYKNFELIIVDDASTDETWEYLQTIKSKQIKIFRNDVSQGPQFCRNLAILNSRGKYITGLDDDDEFLPDRLEKLYNAYDEKYAFVFSEYYIRKANKLILKKNYNKNLLLLNDVLVNGNIVGNQVFTTKEKIINVGLFDEKLKAAQDYDMWIRLLKKYKVAYYLQEPLMIVNISSISISNSSNKIKGYRQLYLKYQKEFSDVAKKYHISTYLINKNAKFFKFIKFLPFNKRGLVLFVKYINKNFFGR